MDCNKKGVGLFFEVFFGNFRDLMKLNLIFCCFAVPSAAALLVGFSGVLTGYMYLLALILAFPIGGALAAYVFCITKMLRDEPGYVWYDFKRKFAENYKQAAAPGMLSAVFVYIQIILWASMIAGDNDTEFFIMVMGLIFLLLFGMVMPYVFLQIAYIDLKLSQILKNSVLISFMNAPRSFIGAVSGGFIWAAFVIFLPQSLLAIPLILLIGFSFSWLLNLIWVWPSVDKQFKIGETLRDRR